MLASELGYLKEADYLGSTEKITEIQKMLVSFIKKLRISEPG